MSRLLRLQLMCGLSLLLLPSHGATASGETLNPASVAIASGGELAEPTACNAEQGTPSVGFAPLTGELSNGLRYIIYSSNAKDTSAALLVKVGFFDERPGQKDIAHVTEHVLLRDTEKFPNSSIRNFLSDRGIQFGGLGGDILMVTGHQFIRLGISANEQATAEPWEILDALKEMAFNARIKELSVETEKKASQIEALGSMAAPSIVNESGPIYWSLYRDGRYTADKFGSLLKSHAAMRVSDVQAFYTAWFQPSNMTLIIASPKNPATYRCYIETVFGSRPSNMLPHRLARPKMHLTGTVDTYVDPELSASRVTFIRGMTPGDRGSYRADQRTLLLELLAQTLLANRWESIRRSDPDGLSIKSDLWSETGLTLPGLGSAMVTEVTGRPGQNSEAILERFGRYVAQIRNYGFSESEISVVMDFALSNARKISQKTAPTNKALVGVIAEDIIMERSQIDVNRPDNAELLESISPKEVMEAARLALAFESQTNFILRVPVKPKISGSILTWFKKGARNPPPFVAPEKEDLIVGDVRPVPPVGFRDLEKGVRELTFSNGIKAILIQNTSARLSAFRNGGLGLYEPASRRKIAALESYADSLRLDRPGRPSLKDISDAIYNLGVDEHGSFVELRAGLSADQFRLAHVIFSQDKENLPAPTDERAPYKLDPVGFGPDQRVARSEFIPEGSGSTRASVQSVEEGFLDRFKKPGDYTFVISVPDLEDGVQLAATYLGSLGSARSQLAVGGGDQFRIKQGPYRLSVGGLPENIANQYLSLVGQKNLSETDFARLKVVESLLDLKIYERLQAVEGVAYNPFAYLEVVEGDDESLTSFAMGIRSILYERDLPRSEAAALEEIEKLREGKFDDASFELAKKRAFERTPTLDRLPIFDRYVDRVVFHRPRAGISNSAQIEAVKNDDAFREVLNSLLRPEHAGILTRRHLEVGSGIDRN